MPELMTHATNGTFNANGMQQVDAAVSEVFGMMLGMQTSLIDTCKMPAGHDVLSAIVGFAGAMSGSCIIEMHQSAALKVTSAMMGATVTEVDNSVKDAIGEVCNMVAGGWKNKLPEIAAECLLSVPTVVSGDNYEVHHSPNTAKFVRAYGFDGLCMTVTILYELAK